MSTPTDPKSTEGPYRVGFMGSSPAAAVVCGPFLGEGILVGDTREAKAWAGHLNCVYLSLAAASVRPVPPPEPVGAAEGKPQYLVEDGELQERLDRALLRAREAEAKYYAEGIAQGKREERQRLALRFSRFVEAYHHDFCEQSDNPCECGWCLMLKDWNELDLSLSAPSSGTTDQGERS